MTDIIVTYLNDKDKQWQEDFKYWKDKEIKEGKAKESNRQAFGEERIRDWDTIKYFFRGIEQNCPWVNKIFLIVQNENHIPKWLNRNNPKLRIVYHDEYIPKDLLPTFNALLLGIYISNIKDLSENFIKCDDDYFFMNPIKEDKFFRYGLPVHKRNEVSYGYYNTSGEVGVFWKILNNDLDFEKRFNKKIKYGIYHLPEARKKSFEQSILKQYGEEIKSHFTTSKFRHETNLCADIYSDILKLQDKVFIDDPYKNSAYCTLNSKVNFNDYSNKEMVCFNDTELLDDYDKTKEKLIGFLDNKFPNKSSFEV